jgi:glycosyltransferase involved in cell wall biosynthesis
VAGEPRIIVLGADSSWNLVNFRGALVRGLQQAGYRPVAVAPLYPAAEDRMAKLGIERIAVPVHRPPAEFRLLKEYRNIFSQLRPAAVLGFTAGPNIYGSLAAASLGVPAIPNVSGIGPGFARSGPLQALATTLYRRAFRDAAMVFFQNPDDRQLFINRRIVGLDETRQLPGSGVDLDHFSLAPQPDGPPTFLLFSRLLRDKGVIEFVEAAHMLREQMPDARFQLLGPVDDGSRGAVRRSEIERWIKDGVIEYLGVADDVRPHVAAASAVVLPSYREGMPRPLLEAAAIGRPLVATHVAGCREVVDDGVNGFLCNPAEPSSLASAMKKLAELPRAARSAMGDASRRKVQDRFSEDVVVRAYLDVLGNLPVGQP